MKFHRQMDETQFSNALHALEAIIRMCYEAKDEPGSKYMNHALGDLHGFKWALSATFGDDEKDRVLDAFRKKTKLAVPHTGIMDEDGSQLGFDSDMG